MKTSARFAAAPIRQDGIPARVGVLRAQGLASLAGALALAVTGCTAGTEPGASISPAGSPTTAPAASTTLSGEKTAAGATLPAEVDGWKLAKRQDGASGAKVHFYAKPDDPKTQLVATLTLVPLTPDALTVVLPDARQIGSATCGNVAGGVTALCYVPLSGGNLAVTAPLTLDELGAVAGHLYAALG